MDGECTLQMDATVDTEANRKQTTQSVKASSKLSTALLVLTLCLTATAAVSVYYRHTKGSGQDEETVDIRHTLRQLSNVRAAIHLEGEYNPHVKTSVEWKNQVDQSFSQGGLKLDHNEIVIPRSGLYFIYSQASFRVSCSGGDDEEDADEGTSSEPLVHLSHTVQRWSSTYGNDDTKKSYETILHSIRTVCQKTAGGGSNGRWFSSVNVGAVFSLSRGDRLRTVTEERMLPDLEDEPGKNFFGVFAL